MKKIISIVSILATLFIVSCATTKKEVKVKDFGDSTKLLDFETGMPGVVNPNGAEINLVDSEFGKGMEIAFKVSETNSYPGVKLTYDTPMDFTGKTLNYDLYNNTSEIVTYNMRVDSVGNDNAGGVEGSFSYIITAEPNVKTNVTLQFTEGGRNYGMQGLPGSINKKLWGANLNLSEVYQIIFYQVTPTKDGTVVVDNLALTPTTDGGINVEGIVDEFGQYSREDYEDKIYSLEDLQAKRAEEEAELANVIPGSIEGRSQYGGWLNEDKRLAPGEFFRVEKVGEKWWMVDPDGYPFFSTGLDIMRTGDGFTVVAEREDMFQSLPAKDGDFEEHWDYATNLFKAAVSEGDIFNPYTANLERKYGENWKEEWKQTALKRTAGWGFTSFGNWADEELFYGQGEENKVTYFGHGWINGDFNRYNSGSNYWGPLSDPFDPKFKDATELMAETLYSQIGDDPWCAGIFVDNEMSWGNKTNDKMYFGLIYSVLAANIDSPAKAALIPMLKEKYDGDISKLNAIWGKDLTWADLEASYDVESNITEGMKTDLSFLLNQYARQYYSVVKSVLRAVGFKQMYIGNRMADWGRPEEVIRASAEFCDVVSFNWYKTGVDKREFTIIEELDVPVIIGEFHFGAKDRGHFKAGIIAASSQAERAKLYKNYMLSVLDNPFFVGAHWFQYYDQPITGRAWDGENNNIGFVSITDIPYAPLVNTVKSLNKKLYDVRDSSTIFYNPDQVRSNFTPQSFEGDDENVVIKTYKGSKYETVEEGVTDGSLAAYVSVGPMDGDYGGLNFTPTPDIGKTWNWGSNCSLKMDVSNPSGQKIQLRMNITDIKGNLRTYYFVVKGKESRTLEISNEDLGPHADNWDPIDGFWGAGSGLDTENIAEVTLYMWEDNDFGSASNKFILDNLRIEN